MRARTMQAPLPPSPGPPLGWRHARSGRRPLPRGLGGRRGEGHASPERAAEPARAGTPTSTDTAGGGGPGRSGLAGGARAPPSRTVAGARRGAAVPRAVRGATPPRPSAPSASTPSSSCPTSTPRPPATPLPRRWPWSSPTSRASPASPPAARRRGRLQPPGRAPPPSVGPIMRSRGGRVVKRIGDGLMLTFPSAEAAVHAALEPGRRCRATAAPAGRGPLRRGRGHRRRPPSATTSTSPPASRRRVPAARCWPPSPVRDAVGELRGVRVRAGAGKSFKGVGEAVSVYPVAAPDTAGGRRPDLEIARAFQAAQCRRTAGRRCTRRSSAAVRGRPRRRAVTARGRSPGARATRYGSVLGLRLLGSGPPHRASRAERRALAELLPVVRRRPADLRPGARAFLARARGAPSTRSVRQLGDGVQTKRGRALRDARRRVRHARRAHHESLPLRRSAPRDGGRARGQDLRWTPSPTRSTAGWSATRRAPVRLPPTPGRAPPSACPTDLQVVDARRGCDPAPDRPDDRRRAAAPARVRVPDQAWPAGPAASRRRSRSPPASRPPSSRRTAPPGWPSACGASPTAWPRWWSTRSCSSTSPGSSGPQLRERDGRRRGARATDAARRWRGSDASRAAHAPSCASPRGRAMRGLLATSAFRNPGPLAARA